MANKEIHLQVLTPSKTALDQGVDYVILRTRYGDMGVLPGHEPCAVTLGAGLLRAYIQKEEIAQLAIMGGFAMVQDDRVTVMSHLAEPPALVEQELERRKQERMENLGREHRSEVEIQRAEMALRRALLGVDSGALAVYQLHDSEEEQDEEE